MERCEWTVYQEVEKKKAEDEAEKERSTLFFSLNFINLLFILFFNLFF